MQFNDFQRIISRPRMQRYLNSCAGDTRKAMNLYRLNLKASQEVFTIISCFEIALRNAIDSHYLSIHGNDWLRDSQRPGGIFTVRRCRVSRGIISQAYTRISSNYSHSKLVAEMDFGFWRYLFAQPQYFAGGQNLLRIFQIIDTSYIEHKYLIITKLLEWMNINHTQLFYGLDHIDKLVLKLKAL